ncbi:MAG: hypothetical protein AB7I18_11080 [Candidatus Berkiella sp.]
MKQPKSILIIKELIQGLKEIRSKNKHYTNAGINVFFNKRWIDCRIDDEHPFLSLFISEENLIERKGNSCKYELAAHIEGYQFNRKDNDIYYLLADVKHVLLKNWDSFSLLYQGHELTIPEEGASITSVQIKFKIIYMENIS